MKCHLTSLFQRVLRKDETYRVSRSNRAFAFFKNECQNDITIDSNGDLIVRAEREPVASRAFLDRIIDISSDSYTYFLNEYRQNSPVRDCFGNIILNDEIVMQRNK